jgi:hypothetical protein
MKITQRNIIQIILALTLCLNLVTMVITLEKSGKHKQNFHISKLFYFIKKDPILVISIPISKK